MKAITTRINEQLRRANLEPRFVRGRGYYYVRHVAVSSGLYACWLDNSSERDYRIARDHVNEVLRNEGVDFQLQ